RTVDFHHTITRALPGAPKRNPSRALLRETGSNCLFARLLQGSLPEGLWMRSERASRRPWSTTGRKPGSAARILMGGLRTA
ncbi:hypothetical protein, partial [Sutterella wadsworthensis]|uniref:hypothetical protein n=1 Tax=Sutterella wadsworthensis TaxID=40545 RepID=UPI00308078C7